MPLEADRKKASEQILLAKDKSGDPVEVVKFLKAWFDSLKAWEAQETFERAFSENRMCARMAPSDGIGSSATQSKDTFGPRGKVGTVTLRYHIGATPLYQEPANFAAGASRKNELGLHDVSAVLLDSRRSISSQLFSKVGRQPIFIPIPHEEDLQLLYQIEQVAKADRVGPIYDFYVWARARITRIKYGADEDMKTGFYEYSDAKGTHYRYGDAREGGAKLDTSLLQQRRVNALQYKSKVLTGKMTDNNEVTLKIRHHAGGFPWAAIQGPLAPPVFPFDVPAGEFLVAEIKQGGAPLGYVTDGGKFRKRR
jgi:hypothetical protein